METNIATPPDSIAPRVVTIAEGLDLTLRVTEYNKPLQAGEDGHDKIKAIVDFNVTRQYLVDNSESEVIKKLLTTREFAEAGQSIINLDEHNPLAVEAILCAIYRKNESWRLSTLGEEVTARTLNLGLDHRILQPFPYDRFNHIEGFLFITEYLVYNSAHVKEYKNTKHPDLHVPPRVISALNSARGHLRVLLARWLWNPMDDVLKAKCRCKEKTVFQYLKALTDTDGWPVDQQSRKSVNEVCEDLKTFKEHFSLPASHNICINCGRDWHFVVANAIAEIQGYFDGMCLDCMDHTQPKFLDEHTDYWNHLDPEEWDAECRVHHGQATWYSSFMGRADTRNELLSRVRSQKRRNY
ncbi:hypothetical protein M436DRAFT_79419 [Aureobasidium namibiae CBS 147.97]|uniref:Uncharacterized protein n=1 Tax=Aureobasidium namibiae CBS 147.97 TaxID=1043004 RepID=A0A074WXF6_9PEZI|nr:uncharacterized protein M436DRAFT_79419 [Aureobasidium namibiae CBS 147.97]KEQ76164.1 hypothetical protein M436DRAFT_79419 [Aureobasidium namibiae CBS 147.97]